MILRPGAAGPGGQHRELGAGPHRGDSEDGGPAGEVRAGPGPRHHQHHPPGQHS